MSSSSSKTAAADGMSQEQAQWLFSEGAMLVFLDVPPGTEFGVDYNSWAVGEKFKGVKMIPPGIHFVYYSAVGRDRQVAPRTGFMHCFARQEVLVKKWDKQAEDMSEESVTEEEQWRIEENRQELDRYLGAYPYDSYKKWVSLTNHMTPALLRRLSPTCGKISAVTPLQSVGSTTQSRREDALAREVAREAVDRQDTGVTDRQAAASTSQQESSGDSLLPDMKPYPGTEIRFTRIPRQKFPPSCSAGERTRHSMDHSYVLHALLASEAYADDPLSILGELQYAFITFLIGQVFDGFEQWKQLVDLLCSCVDAVASLPSLYSHLIAVLHFHVLEIPEDFFVDIVSRENFLTASLRKFFENLDAADAEGGGAVGVGDGGGAAAVRELKKRGARFRAHLESRFRWDFGSELDEYAPVVVVT